ncbi:hypothetical protein [uncultured Parabacteroides sp.]|uniref:hypothetical protein n=1 Tax=uncultured Parabacteroides sp. TaxID=512312 RepID=UPI00260D20AD|nr:hypothetical protein [uncultured Parabacteroides sp.]
MNILTILKFTKNEDMNENKIIDRKFFADLAEEYALNTSHFEWLGGVRHPEIVVKGGMLDRLIELQSQFKRLGMIGDDIVGFILNCHAPRQKRGEIPMN